MLTLIKIIFFTFLIVVGLFFLSIGGLFLKLFSKRPTSRTQDFGSNSSRSNTNNTGGRASDDSSNDGQKVFGKDEGEYVDFVEVEEKEK